jgi:hypothetical protein
LEQWKREWKPQTLPEVEDRYLYLLTKSSHCSLTHTGVSALVGLESSERVARHRSLRPEGPKSPDLGKFLGQVSGVGEQSLRPHYWPERHPEKRHPKVLDQSLWSQAKVSGVCTPRVSGQETRSLLPRQYCKQQIARGTSPTCSLKRVGAVVRETCSPTPKQRVPLLIERRPIIIN